MEVDTLVIYSWSYLIEFPSTTSGNPVKMTSHSPPGMTTDRDLLTSALSLYTMTLFMAQSFTCCTVCLEAIFSSLVPPTSFRISQAERDPCKGHTSKYKCFTFHSHCNASLGKSTVHVCYRLKSNLLLQTQKFTHDSNGNYKRNDWNVY